MPIKDVFATIPAGSLVTVPEEIRTSYIRDFHELPKILAQFVTSLRVGAYIRGLIKSLDLADEGAEIVALAVFQITTGSLTLARLPAMLSTNLKISNDTAQRMSQEIEKELLAPVALELNQHLAQTKRSQPGIRSQLQNYPSRPSAQSSNLPSNILDLKNQQRPPTPPPIPR